MDNYNAKTHQAAHRYQAAYAALCELDPNGEWTRRFKPLDLTKDLHLPRREEDDPHKGRNQGENHRELSWIWLVGHAGGRPTEATEDEINECKCLITGTIFKSSHLSVHLAMRVEWCKQRARPLRWGEEKGLVVEEMRRTIEYFRWKSCWWDERGVEKCRDASPAVLRGLVAYSVKQASVYSKLATAFDEQWSPYLKSQGINVEW